MERILVTVIPSLIALGIFYWLHKLIVKNKDNEEWKQYIHAHEWLWPNSITSFRLRMALIAFVIYLFLNDNHIAVFICTFAYVFAAILDRIDGDIARCFDLKTEDGEKKDSFYDKLQYLIPLIIFGIFNIVSLPTIILLTVFDSIGQTLRWALNKFFGVKSAAEKIGKIKTVNCFILVVFCIMFGNSNSPPIFINFYAFVCLVLAITSCLKKIPKESYLELGIYAKKKFNISFW